MNRAEEVSKLAVKTSRKPNNLIQRRSGDFYRPSDYKVHDKQTLLESTAVTNNMRQNDLSIENNTVKGSIKAIFADREYELYMRLNPELKLQDALIVAIEHIASELRIDDSMLRNTLSLSNPMKKAIEQ